MHTVSLCVHPVKIVAATNILSKALTISLVTLHNLEGF